MSRSLRSLANNFNFKIFSLNSDYALCKQNLYQSEAIFLKNVLARIVEVSFVSAFKLVRYGGAIMGSV